MRTIWAMQSAAIHAADFERDNVGFGNNFSRDNVLNI